MTALNLASVTIPAIPLENIVAAGTAYSSIINTGDFQAVEFYTTINCTSDTFQATISIEESQDPTFTTFNTVDSDFISFSNDSYNLNIDETNTITTRLVGYVGKKQYIRFRVNVTQASNSLISVNCILARPLTIPINYDSSVVPPPVGDDFRVTDIGDFRVTADGDQRIWE